MTERPVGRGRRQLDKFPVVKPTEEIAAQYLRHYTGGDLWFRPKELPPITSEHLFGDAKPLILDIGCGRGEFTIAEAESNQDRNYVGIDTQTKSIWFAVNKASERKLSNVRFIRTDGRSVMAVIPDNSISEIFIMFPSPSLARKHIKKDLLTPCFVGDLHRVMAQGAKLHLATDHEKYFTLKKSLIEQAGLFDTVSSTRKFEGGLTRYQKIWEKHGLETFRAIFRKK